MSSWLAPPDSPQTAQEPEPPHEPVPVDSPAIVHDENTTKLCHMLLQTHPPISPDSSKCVLADALQRRLAVAL